MNVCQFWVRWNEFNSIPSSIQTGALKLWSRSYRNHLASGEFSSEFSYISEILLEFGFSLNGHDSDASPISHRIHESPNNLFKLFLFDSLNLIRWSIINRWKINSNRGLTSPKKGACRSAASTNFSSQFCVCKLKRNLNAVGSSRILFIWTFVSLIVIVGILTGMLSVVQLAKNPFSMVNHLKQIVIFRSSIYGGLIFAIKWM